MGNRTWLVGILLFLGIFVIYVSTSPGNTIYNHFILLADALLHGNLHIAGIYPWLEKIPIDSLNFYVANPPAPAILALPLVAVFGKNIPQQYLAHLFGAGIAVITFFTSLEIRKSKFLAVWSALLLSLGSINWYLSVVGSTWYLAHLVAQLFLATAVLLSLKNLSPFWVGICIGIAYLSRIPTILTLPLFLYFYRKNRMINYSYLFAGILPFLFLNFAYNFLRFGVIWDIGYTMIPGVATEPWYRNGVVHLSYIPSHLKIVLTKLPTFAELISLKPSSAGYAVWFTSPAFAYALFNKRGQKIVLFSWLSILLVSCLIFSHGSTGFSQFGYRFATDFYPILAFLTIGGVASQNGPKRHHWIFLILGVLVNFWGILSLNILSS